MKQTHTNHIRVGFTVRVLSGWNKPHMWLSRRIEGLIVPLTMFLIALPLSMSVITHTEYKPLSCLSVIMLADHFLPVLGAQQCIRELLHKKKKSMLQCNILCLVLFLSTTCLLFCINPYFSSAYLLIDLSLFVSPEQSCQPKPSLSRRERSSSTSTSAHQRPSRTGSAMQTWHLRPTLTDWLRSTHGCSQRWGRRNI